MKNCRGPNGKATNAAPRRKACTEQSELSGSTRPARVMCNYMTHLAGRYKQKKGTARARKARQRTHTQSFQPFPPVPKLLILVK